MCARHSLMAMTRVPCRSCHQCSCAPAALHPCCWSPACRHTCQHPQTPAHSWCAHRTLPRPSRILSPCPRLRATQRALSSHPSQSSLTDMHPRLLQPWHSALPPAPSRQSDRPTGDHPLASTPLAPSLASGCARRLRPCRPPGTPEPRSLHQGSVRSPNGRPCARPPAQTGGQSANERATCRALNR